MTLQQSPYLRQQRDFPNEDIQKLTVEIDKAYIDTAIKVNSRTIGIFATNFQVATGEQWYLTGSSTKQQTLRQIYSITSTAAFNHGINLATVSAFTVIRGVGFDGTNYYPIPYVSPVAAADNIGIYITPTQVMITTGVGSPTLSSAIIVLEWISQF